VNNRESGEHANTGLQMRVLIGADATEFLAHVRNVLRADEVRHGIIYSLAQRLSVDRIPSGSNGAVFIVVLNEDQPLAAALLSSSGVLNAARFSGEPSEAAELIGAALRSKNRAVSAMVGDPELCDLLFRYVQPGHGIKEAIVKEYRIYKLDCVRPVGQPDGRLRRAVAADKPLVAEWGSAFHHEVTGVAGPPLVEPFENRVDTGSIFVWETGAPVCMAGITRPLDSSIGIGPVYTPPEFRNRGYARASVAELCRLQLDAGYACCTLFVDKSNPASAVLYEQIGFEGVCDFVEVVLPQRTG
jgi:GNAT superfamily N-acetyltransferase